MTFLFDFKVIAISALLHGPCKILQFAAETDTERRVTAAVVAAGTYKRAFLDVDLEAKRRRQWRI